MSAGEAPPPAEAPDRAGADPDDAVRRCPLCAGPMYGWIVCRAADPGRPGRWVVDMCAECGHALLREPPEDALGLHEEGAYAARRHRLSTLLAPVLAAFDRGRLRILRRAVAPPARVLEVGAGKGRFLARLAAAGYEADGIEPSPTRAAQARSRGVEVQPTSLERATVEPGGRDAVVAWHVIEHLPDPDAALARMRSWLGPGGVLLLGVPNRASWQCWLGREHWFHLDAPRHRAHYTPRSLELLLGRHGLRVERVRHVLLEHNPFGMWQTLLNALTFHDNVLYNLLNRSLTPQTADSRWKLALDVLVTALAALPAALLAAPLEALAGLRRRGGTIAVLARLEDEGRIEAPDAGS